jgi:hypothetical protein
MKKKKKLFGNLIVVKRVQLGNFFYTLKVGIGKNNWLKERRAQAKRFLFKIEPRL